MGRAERVMMMFYELSRDGGIVSKDDIISEYGITERQLRRDIEYIRDRIISPIAGESDFSIKCIRLDGKSYYRLLGDLSGLKEIRAKSMIADAVAASALDPVRKLLDESQEEDRKRGLVRGRRYVKYLSSASELPDYDLFSKLLGLIESGHRISLCYRRIGKEPFTAYIEPLELINYSSLWYLRAYNLDLQVIRTYSLSRIIDVEDTGELISFSDFEELDRQDDSSYGIFSSSAEPELYTIRFKGTPAFLVSSQIWHKDQEGHFIDDEVYELTVPAISYTELLAKTLSFGPDAWPVSPQDFVEAYKCKVSEMASLRL